MPQWVTADEAGLFQQPPAPPTAPGPPPVVPPIVPILPEPASLAQSQADANETLPQISIGQMGHLGTARLPKLGVDASRWKKIFRPSKWPKWGMPVLLLVMLWLVCNVDSARDPHGLSQPLSVIDDESKRVTHRELVGTTAVITMTARSRDSVYTLARAISKQIWNAARDYPAGQAVKVNIKMHVGNLENQYGEPADGPDRPMGSIDWKNLSDVRKFRTADHFADVNHDVFGMGSTTAVVEMELKRMKYAYLLQDLTK